MPSRIAALVAEHAERASSDAALVEGRTGHAITWRALAGLVAGWTRRSDIAGRAVLLRQERPLEFITAYLGLLAAGAVVFPMAPDAPEADVAAAVDGFDIGGPAPVDWAEPGTVVLRTSGTTGTPKGVPLGEARLLHAAGLVARHHRLDPGDTVYSPLPLFHINAQVVGVLAALMSGATLAVDDRFHRRGFWDVMDRCGVTVLNAVPAILAILAQEPPPPPAVAARIRFARSASAPLPPATLRRFEQRCGIGVLETYGMTEAAGQICANPLDPAARRPGSVGQPVGLEVRLIGDDGAPLGPGAAGLVEILGPTVVDHYLVPGAPPSRAAAGVGGWFRTDDVGYRDDEGFLYLLGRIDGVINRGGEKVYPRVVEEVLRGHPGVAEAAVVGVPDPVLGEVPVAFVVPRAGIPAGDAVDLATQLLRLCERQLSRHQRPARIHLADSLPFTPTGKVRRDALRELATS